MFSYSYNGFKTVQASVTVGAPTGSYYFVNNHRFQWPWMIENVCSKS